MLLSFSQEALLCPRGRVGRRLLKVVLGRLLIRDAEIVEQMGEGKAPSAFNNHHCRLTVLNNLPEK